MSYLLTHRSVRAVAKYGNKKQRQELSLLLDNMEIGDSVVTEQEPEETPDAKASRLFYDRGYSALNGLCQACFHMSEAIDHVMNDSDLIFRRGPSSFIERNLLTIIGLGAVLVVIIVIAMFNAGKSLH